MNLTCPGGPLEELTATGEAGCDMALVHTRPGAATQRNVLRAGLDLANAIHMITSSGGT